MAHNIPHNQNLLAHNSTPRILTCVVNRNRIEDQHQIKFQTTRPNAGFGETRRSRWRRYIVGRKVGRGRKGTGNVCANSGKCPDCATARKKVCIAITLVYLFKKPISLAARLKAWVSGRSFAGVAGWHPAGGMDVCLLCVLCRWKSLQLTDPSSRGV